MKSREKEISKRRDWRKYSKELLNAKLTSTDWNIGVDDVQQYWNIFENMLIKRLSISYFKRMFLHLII